LTSSLSITTDAAITAASVNRALTTKPTMDINANHPNRLFGINAAISGSKANTAIHVMAGL